MNRQILTSALLPLLLFPAFFLLLPVGARAIVIRNDAVAGEITLDKTEYIVSDKATMIVGAPGGYYMQC